VGRTYFRFVTMHTFVRWTNGQTDGRTDRRTAFFWLHRALHYTQSHGKKEIDERKKCIQQSSDP